MPFAKCLRLGRFAIAAALSLQLTAELPGSGSPLPWNHPGTDQREDWIWNVRSVPKAVELLRPHLVTWIHLEDLPWITTLGFGPNIQHLVLKDLANLGKITDGAVDPKMDVTIKLSNLPKLQYPLPAGLASERVTLEMAGVPAPKTLHPSFARLKKVRLWSFSKAATALRWPTCVPFQGTLEFCDWSVPFLANVDLSNSHINVSWDAHNRDILRKFFHSNDTDTRRSAWQQITDGPPREYLAAAIAEDQRAQTLSGGEYGEYLLELLNKLPRSNSQWSFVQQAQWQLAIGPLRDPKWMIGKLNGDPGYLAGLLGRVLRGPDRVVIADQGEAWDSSSGSIATHSGALALLIEMQNAPPDSRWFAHENKINVLYHSYLRGRPIENFEIPAEAIRIDGSTLAIGDPEASDQLCVQLRRKGEDYQNLASAAIAMADPTINPAPLKVVGLRKIHQDHLNKVLHRENLDADEVAKLCKITGLRGSGPPLDALVYRCSKNYLQPMPERWEPFRATVINTVARVAKLTTQGLGFNILPPPEHEVFRPALHSLEDDLFEPRSAPSIPSARKRARSPQCNEHGLKGFVLKQLHPRWHFGGGSAEGFARALLSARLLLATNLAEREERTWQAGEPPPTWSQLEAEWQGMWRQAVTAYRESCIAILVESGIDRPTAKSFVVELMANLCSKDPERRDSVELFARSLRAWHTREYAYYVAKGEIPDDWFLGASVKVADCENITGCQDGRFTTADDEDSVGPAQGFDPCYLFEELRTSVALLATMALTQHE